MSWVLTVLGFVALILIHEFGHFAAAKAVGMRVERFSLFFGRPLVRVRRGETDYTIGPIPLGGYVKISGMNPRELEQESDSEGDDTEALRARAYCNQPVWKRIVVIAAGPAMNLLLAFVLLAGIYHFDGYPHTYIRGTTIVGSIVPGSPASTVLRKNDQLVAVDGQRGPYKRLSALIASHRCPGAQVQGCRAATPAQLTVKRGKRLLQLAVYPRYDTKDKPARPRIGVGFYEEQIQTPVPASVGGAASDSLTEMWSITSLTVSKFAQIFTSSKARAQIHTVAGISDELSEAFSYSTPEALFILALVSLSLAVINLFPFLPLDGGHIFWALAEKVRRRPIPVGVMERASAAGIALVLFIFLIGFSNDIHTFTNGGFPVK